jgi:hypothetical protein
MPIRVRSVYCTIYHDHFLCEFKWTPEAFEPFFGYMNARFDGKMRPQNTAEERHEALYDECFQSNIIKFFDHCRKNAQVMDTGVGIEVPS